MSDMSDWRRPQDRRADEELLALLRSRGHDDIADRYVEGMARIDERYAARLAEIDRGLALAQGEYEASMRGIKARAVFLDAVLVVLGLAAVGVAVRVVLGLCGVVSP